ncbi:MAG: cysteine desulfurase [Flavobacteriales bacterium]|nr:cysteine desulfurase [Flavobacteriales bacterium]
MSLDVQKIRKNFPILQREVYDQPLVYLDNGASSQKPISVIETIDRYYRNEHSNIHRGVHYLSSTATDKYEQARKKVQTFLNAEHEHECLFTKGTTDGINLVAHSFGKKFLSPGDNVIISEMEHHSNIVPWQMICDEKGATLKVIPINDAGELLMDEYKKLLNDKTAIVSITHVSNTLGTINPIKEIIDLAHEKGAAVLIDGAQAVQHMAVDVRELDADFYTFSGHKMYGPTGVGILYGKEKWLNEMPPYQGGGDMIKTVTFEKTTYNELPHKFEAGTPNIVGGIGLGAAIDYMNSVGIDEIAAYEEEIKVAAHEALSAIDGLTIYGTANSKAAVFSFLLDGIHPYDAGTILDRLGIAIRTGHHCTEPLMARLGIPGTVRASFAFYNTMEEIDVLVAGIERVKKMFA